MSEDNGDTILHALNRLSIATGNHIASLKDGQKQTVQASIDKDVISILPTGYGKTMIFSLLPYITCMAVIICSPLNAIIEEQLKAFGSSAQFVDDEFLKNPSGGNMKALYFIGHPEKLCSAAFKTFLDKELVLFSHFVIDEAHTVLSWGNSNFRPAFKKIKSLRTFLPLAKMLALTATATKEDQELISIALKMRDPVKISFNPDRANVFLAVVHDTLNGEDWCLDVGGRVIRELTKDTVKTIIYVKLEWCGLLHDLAAQLGKQHMVGQFHSPQTDIMKAYLSKQMLNDGLGNEIRLLLATEAYSMGANPPDVQRVIHIGVPSSIELYLQMMGRAGRNGGNATDTIHYNNYEVAGNKTHIHGEIKEYCKLNSCRREFTLNYFDFKKDPNMLPHDCCDNCRHTCECDTCVEQRVIVTKPPKVKELPKTKVLAIERSLNRYFDLENSIETTTLACITLKTGLTRQLAKDISKSAHLYASEISLKDVYTYLDPHYLHTIYDIIVDVKKL